MITQAKKNNTLNIYYEIICCVILLQEAYEITDIKTNNNYTTHKIHQNLKQIKSKLNLMF